MRFILLFVFILSLGACKTYNTTDLKTATEIEQESINLTTYTASPEVLRNFRKKYENEYKTIDPNFRLFKFCTIANFLRSRSVNRTKDLPFHNLKIEELVALYHYTAQYYGINKYLRSDDKNERSKVKYSTLVTSSALNRIPYFQGMVYRGLVLTNQIFTTYSEAAKTGKTLTEKAFLSTSLSPSVAMSFSDSFYNGESAVLFISSKYGHALGSGADEPVEREVLFSPGSEFKVRSITTKTYEEMTALADALRKKLPPLQKEFPTSSDPMVELTECEPPSECAAKAADTSELMECDRNAYPIDTPVIAQLHENLTPAQATSTKTGGSDSKNLNPNRFVGPIGEIPAAAALLENDKDWNKDIKGKVVVIEMEEVTPKP